MRRFWFIAMTLILMGSGPEFSRAQSSEDFSALRFNGGNVFSDVRFGSNLFGSGMGSGSFGRVQSALQKVDGAVVFGNPASLAHVSRGQVGMEFRFPMRNGSLGLGSSSLLTQSAIKGETDEFLSNLSFPSGQVPVYTSASHVVVGQPRQLSAFWMTWPVNETVGIGFGYRQPLFVSSEIAISGASALLRGSSAEQGSSVQVDFLAELALNSDLNVRLDELSIGSGGLLEKYYFGDVWWGISLYRSSASVSLNLDVLPQGLLTISGSDQFFFNDALDPNLDASAGESNNFFWKVRTAFRGSGIGGRIGLVHRTYGSRFGTSLLLNVAPRINMQDNNAEATSFLPVFVNLQGVINNEFEENTDLLDIEALDLARPNLTRQTHDSISNWMTIHLPTSLTFGVDLPFGQHNFVVNLIKYWGSTSLEGEYGTSSGQAEHFKIGKKSSWGVRAGLDFARPSGRRSVGSWDLPLRLLTLDVDGILFELLGDWTGYDSPRYRVSGGVQWGEALTQGIDNTVVNDIDSFLGGGLPTSVSVGRAYSLFDRLDVGVHVFGVPDLLMRVSLALNFD